MKMTTNNAEHAINLLNSSVTKLPPPADSIFYVKNLEKDYLKYVIDTLYVETKGLELEIHSELVDEKLGRYEMHADVEEGDEFTRFTVSKEDMKFVMDKLSELKPSKDDANLLKGGVTTLPPPEDSIFNIKNLEKLSEIVNHPKHYTSHPSGIETIEITRWMNFNLGNSIKYILRSGKKSEDTAIQDLEKAVWYLNDEIKRLKGEYNK
jgi:hypothetical protein